ncbi:SDR family oxidoreductase [Alphaproteobacteria bacterium]|nr:SDR family oxidoreductase [Alphaproteobacteria bacterium]
MKIFLTGASGFVGHAIALKLAENKDLELRVSTRKNLVDLPISTNVFQIPTLDANTDWHKALLETEVVIHSAALAHVMHYKTDKCLEKFRKINVEGTLNLARQAILAGVRRFVFISSIKVNGEYTDRERPFKADDKPAPSDPYGISKMEAEQGLIKLADQTRMEIVIVRPVLVYGLGVKANFYDMMKWISKSIPLPLGAIHNSRSMLALDNLVDFIMNCLTHPAAAGEIFLVSDGEDVSTTELLRRTAKAMGKTVLLFPVPKFCLKFLATLLGKKIIANRICNSLQVDIKKNKRLLNWKPPLSLDQGLDKAVESFKQ